MSFAELLQSPATSKNLVFEKFDLQIIFLVLHHGHFQFHFHLSKSLYFHSYFSRKQIENELSLPLNLWGRNCCLFATLVTWDSQVFSNPDTAIDQLARIDTAHDPLYLTLIGLLKGSIQNPSNGILLLSTEMQRQH